MDGGQPMNNFSTLQSWDTFDLHTLKKAGADEYHGPCPVTGAGKDCFWIQPGHKLLGCRSCSLDGGRLEGQQFKEHLEALGATFGEHDVLLSYEWLDHASGETVIQTRHAGAKKYLWPKDTKTGGLVYLGERYDRDATRPIVWTEGAKAATAAAAKLPADDYDVIGFVSSSNRTGTMEEELNEAGAAGYRVVGMQGGETGFGGNQVVVIMALDPEGRRFRYVLLATSRTGTLESELNELPPGFSFVGPVRRRDAPVRARAGDVR